MGTLTRHQRVAGRAYERVLAQLTEGMEECWRADRHFDGGEWSDAAYDLMHGEMQEKAARIVGERFDIHWEAILCIAEYDMPTEHLHFLWEAHADTAGLHRP